MEGTSGYFHQLMEVISNNAWVIHHELLFREIDDDEAYIRGELYLQGGIILHVAEYITVLNNEVKRLKYRYQLQDHQNNLIVRWDNAQHHPGISTYPFIDGRITPSPPMSIPQIFSEMDNILSEN
jgi:hypothetical protein